MCAMKCGCFFTSKSMLWLRVSIQHWGHMEKVQVSELASKLASGAASACRTSVSTAEPNSGKTVIISATNLRSSCYGP